MANRWDVIVIGLGGVGSATAYHLAATGHRVLGIDRYAPVHDLGSSHGQTRIIRQAYFEHPSYVPLLRRAYELWDDLERHVNAELFVRTGLVELGPPDGVVIPGIRRSAAEHQLAIEILDSREVARRWSGVRCEEDWVAVVERDAGFLHVEPCVSAHLQAARRSGASLVHGADVVSWRIDGQGVSVTTDQGVERSQSLVIATGAWSGSLLHQLGVTARVLRKQMHWHPTDERGFGVEDGFPCFFHETETGFFYGFPRLDRRGVKVARHSGGRQIDRPSQTHDNDDEDERLVQQYVDRYLPGVNPRTDDRAGCYYTMTPDEHFILDRHPDHPQVVIVAGLSGHGFKFTSVLGEIASQLATGRDRSHDIRLFRIDRF